MNVRRCSIRMRLVSRYTLARSESLMALATREFGKLNKQLIETSATNNNKAALSFRDLTTAQGDLAIADENLQIGVDEMNTFPGKVKTEKDTLIQRAEESKLESENTQNQMSTDIQKEFSELSEALDALLEESKTKIGTMIDEADIKMKKGIEDQRQEFDGIVQGVADAKAFRQRQEQDLDTKVQLSYDAEE